MDATFAWWDALFERYIDDRLEVLRAREHRRFEFPIEALARFAHPEPEDVAWIVAALRTGPEDEGLYQILSPFILQLVKDTGRLADALFEPFLDAAIDEVDPSSNRWFIEPCVRTFGVVRVYRYLAHVFEFGDDYRKTGAINAMYWAQVPADRPAAADREALEKWYGELRAAQDRIKEELAPACEGFQLLKLETFVRTSDIHLRRALIGTIDLVSPAGTARLRQLQAAVLEIAGGLDDDYIQHILAQISGKTRLLKAIPHRRRRGT